MYRLRNYTMSKMVPSFVQTGFSNGRSERLQQSKGNFAMGTFGASFLPPHSYLCSVMVMNILSLLCLFFPIFI